MKNILFICGKNQLRSPTAENIFSQYEELDVRSAGVDNDAVHIVDSEDLEWADLIFVMEQKHKEKLLNKFRDLLKDKKIIVLDIPDMYGYLDERLIADLGKKISRWV